MSIEIRRPNITGRTSAEQLWQMKSYLYQLADQLGQALNLLESSSKGGEFKSGEAEFEAVKPHIIKSAEIFNAYFGTVNRRLSGKYLSRGDFSKYAEDTDLKLEANSKGIDQLYTRMESVDSMTKTMDSALTSVTAHIRSGYLCDDGDGNPVYGVEIGQTTEKDGVETFNKFARFSAGRLTFYDDEGNELAHISGQKLAVPQIQVDGKNMVSHVCDLVSFTAQAAGESFTLSGRKWSDGRAELRGCIELSHRAGETGDGGVLSLPLTFPQEMGQPFGVLALPLSDLPLSLSYDREESALKISSPNGTPARLAVEIFLTAGE